jgi:copper chaperone CopZ
MNKFLTLTVAIAVLVLAPGCFRQEIQTEEYHVPDMSTPAAAAYIQNKIKGVPGIKKTSVNVENRLITVNYESSTIRTMNIEEAIALSGFSVNDRPANPKAKLPEGLK